MSPRESKSSDGDWREREWRLMEAANFASEAVRRAALPLTVKRGRRRNYEHSSSSPDSERHGGKQPSRWQRFRASCSSVWVAVTVWRHSFKQIEGMYGSGVRALFEFLKVMFLMDLFVSIAIGVLVIMPQGFNFGLNYQAGMMLRMQGSNETFAATAYTCTMQYDRYLVSYMNNASIVTLVQDVLQGTGFLEVSPIMFIGYYFPDYVQLGSVQYNMPLAYIIALGLVYLFSLVYMLVRTGTEFKEAVLLQGTKSKEPLTHLTVATWDFSLMDGDNAKLGKKMMRNALISELDDQIYLQNHGDSCTCGHCFLWFRRILVNILVLGLLVAGGVFIVYCQQVSSQYTSNNQGSSGDLDIASLFYEYLPVISVALVGSVLPVIFQLLVKLEGYRDEVTVFVTLLRTTFTNLASLAVFMASVFTVLLCSTKDSCNIGTGSCDRIQCWETYVGQEFYKMGLMFFIKLLLMTFVVDFGRAAVGRGCNCGMASLIGPAEFDIPKHVLEVVSSQITLWFGVFFCPMLAPMTTVTMFLAFYCKKFGCHFCYKPSERPFKATRATTFFMMATFLGYFMCIIPVGFLITQVDASRSCSPFRKNSTIYSVIPGVTSSFSEGVQDFLGFLSSPGFLYFVILILIIIIYYYATVASAEKERLEIYEKMLEDEGDRFLIHQLAVSAANPKRETQSQQKQKEAALATAVAANSEESRAAPDTAAASDSFELDNRPAAAQLSVKSAFLQGLERV